MVKDKGSNGPSDDDAKLEAIKVVKSTSTLSENVSESARTRAKRATSHFTRWTVAHKRHSELESPDGNRRRSSGVGIGEAETIVEVQAGARSPSADAYPPNLFRTSKYTALSFLPLNLFEQFRRVANFYFLVIFLMQLIPGVSPYPLIITILPLTFILGVTALKEGWKIAAATSSMLR